MKWAVSSCIMSCICHFVKQLTSQYTWLHQLICGSLLPRVQLQQGELQSLSDGSSNAWAASAQKNHVAKTVGSDRNFILLNITQNYELSVWKSVIFALKIGYRNEKVMMNFTVGVRFATNFQAPNLGSQSRNHPNNKFLNDHKDSKSFKGVLWWTMGSFALRITGVITNTQNWSTRHCFHPGFMNFQQWQVRENVPLKQKGRNLHL